MNFTSPLGMKKPNVRPDTDFALYYSIGESEAFHMLSYRDPSDPADPDGFFLALLAPRPNAAVQPVPKDVILVSGSLWQHGGREVHAGPISSQIYFGASQP